MSAVLEATRPEGQTKKFGKGEREIPHHTQKAKKWYPADDEAQHKKVRPESSRARCGADGLPGDGWTMHGERSAIEPRLCFLAEPMAGRSGYNTGLKPRYAILGSATREGRDLLEQTES
jgi:hypothetical protein